jgi:hypothetical protein
VAYNVELLQSLGVVDAKHVLLAFRRPIYTALYLILPSTSDFGCDPHTSLADTIEVDGSALSRVGLAGDLPFVLLSIMARLSGPTGRQFRSPLRLTGRSNGPTVRAAGHGAFRLPTQG